MRERMTAERIAVWFEVESMATDRLVWAADVGIHGRAGDGRQASARGVFNGPLRQPRCQDPPTTPLAVPSPAQLARRRVLSGKAWQISDHHDWRRQRVNPAARPALFRRPPSDQRPRGQVLERSALTTACPAPSQHRSMRSAQPRSEDRRSDTTRQPRPRGFPCACVTLTASLFVILLGVLSTARDGPSEPIRTKNAIASSVRITPTPWGAPTTTVTTAGTVGVPATDNAPTIRPGEALDYFTEVAFGSEFGDGAREIRKWAVDPKISVHGNPNRADLATLNKVVTELNEIIGSINIEVVEVGGNVDLHFAPERQFAAIEPSVVPGSSGFFWMWWEGGGTITNGRVLVSTDVHQPLRNHIIREEVTQMLGLMNDSFSYSDSIFYERPSMVQSYSVLDEHLIEMLYRPEITVGMNVDQARAVIGQ